jgi:hypothetical protein
MKRKGLRGGWGSLPTFSMGAQASSHSNSEVFSKLAAVTKEIESLQSELVKSQQTTEDLQKKIAAKQVELKTNASSIKQEELSAPTSAPPSAPSAPPSAPISGGKSRRTRRFKRRRGTKHR